MSIDSTFRELVSHQQNIIFLTLRYNNTINQIKFHAFYFDEKHIETDVRATFDAPLSYMYVTMKAKERLLW